MIMEIKTWIPFDGFYESTWSSLIDQEIDYALEYIENDKQEADLDEDEMFILKNIEVVKDNIWCLNETIVTS
jgi:hypothetical protein